MKVNKDFVLERIRPYIGLTKHSGEDIYGKDYSVRHNNIVLEGEHTKIYIENDLIEVYNIEIIKNTVSFSGNFFNIKFDFFADLEENEEIYFKIDLDTEIKILISLEQYHKIYDKHLNKFFESTKTKSPEFLNIIYPSSANIEENYNMQQNMFLFTNLRPKLTDNNLFYELSFYTRKEEISGLKYFYKKTLNKHFFYTKRKVLKCYEYEE